MLVDDRFHFLGPEAYGNILLSCVVFSLFMYNIFVCVQYFSRAHLLSVCMCHHGQICKQAILDLNIHPRV